MKCGWISFKWTAYLLEFFLVNFDKVNIFFCKRVFDYFKECISVLKGCVSVWLLLKGDHYSRLWRGCSIRRFNLILNTKHQKPVQHTSYLKKLIFIGWSKGRVRDDIEDPLARPRGVERKLIGKWYQPCFWGVWGEGDVWIGPDGADDTTVAFEFPAAVAQVWWHNQNIH